MFLLESHFCVPLCTNSPFLSFDIVRRPLSRKTRSLTANIVRMVRPHLILLPIHTLSLRPRQHFNFSTIFVDCSFDLRIERGTRSNGVSEDLQVSRFNNTDKSVFFLASLATQHTDTDQSRRRRWRYDLPPDWRKREREK